MLVTLYYLQIFIDASVLTGQTHGKGTLHYQATPCGINVQLPTNLRLEEKDIDAVGSFTLPGNKSKKI